MANSLVVVDHIPLCIQTIADKYSSVVTAHSLNRAAFSTWWYAAMDGLDDWTDWLIDDRVIDSLQARGRCLPGPLVKVYTLEDILIEVGLHGDHLDNYYDQMVRNIETLIPDTPLPRYRAHTRDTFELIIRGAFHENRR